VARRWPRSCAAPRRSRSAASETQGVHPQHQKIPIAYDGDGQLEQVGSGGGATTYGYDSAGNRTTTNLPNGIVETRTYDHADRLTEIASMDGATSVDDVTYTLDGVSNPLTKTSSSGTETYTYDEMNQLASVCFAASCPDPEDDQITFDYDKVGKRLNSTVGDGTTSTTTTYCYAADSDVLLGTITSGTCLSLTPDRTYDANGNLTSDATRDYTYDLENRVTSIDDGTTSTSYGYDADGKRIHSDDGTTAHDYFWDSTYQDPQLAVSDDGTATRSYRYGHGRISTTDGTTDQYFLADRIGSVLHVTDAGADIDWSYEYDPFGNVRSASHVDPLSPDNDMQYAGEQLDPTGLIHLRARQYDATSGRFLSPDPVTPDIDDPYVSAYVYANNRPGVMTDPSGMIAQYSQDQLNQVSVYLTAMSAAIATCAPVAAAATAAGVVPLAALECMAIGMSYLWAAYAILNGSAPDFNLNLSVPGGGDSSSEESSSSAEVGRSSSSEAGQGDWRADGASESAEDIADKAWGKHRKEFPEFNSEEQLAGHVRDVVNNPKSEVATNGEKTAWRGPDGTIVISDPQRTQNPGSVYRPSPPGSGWPPEGFA
jgi:RHS repeat-associated protein